ncbi:unnamed protein product [Acanthosepion pharaonis]|uniref:Uncharacterized protein n=1 Tax=Acanthosepion pharaonis TaxID=158019 RepID=A0A812ELD5_ACAPH|nr:unnamed protein product [Sepia pharaonis]
MLAPQVFILSTLSTPLLFFVDGGDKNGSPLKYIASEKWKVFFSHGSKNSNFFFIHLYLRCLFSPLFVCSFICNTFPFRPLSFLISSLFFLNFFFHLCLYSLPILVDLLDFSFFFTFSFFLSFFFIICYFSPNFLPYFSFIYSSKYLVNSPSFHRIFSFSFLRFFSSNASFTISSFLFFLN